MPGKDRGPLMTEEERLILVNWVTKNLPNFTNVDNSQEIYLLKWYVCTKEGNLPSCFWLIKQRLLEKENLLDYSEHLPFEDFIGYLPEGAFIAKHKDSNLGNKIVCRFNVFLELPLQGGDTYYDSSIVEAKEGHYVLCRSGFDMHWINTVEKGRRITISFGFLFPIDKVINM